MDLRGKTVVVTGGTSGIGRATALALARRGAEVVAIGRDAGKGATLERELRVASGGAGSFAQADLSLVAEAQRVVAAILARFDRVDALILSAGVIELEPAVTAEGLDRSYVTNFLHKLVVAEGLKPALTRGTGRIVLVAASIPRVLGIDWRNFEGPRTYGGLRATGRLHIASLAVMQHLATEWRSDGIEVTAIHPGQVDTGIFRTFARWPWRVLQALASLRRVTIDKPVALLSWLAFAPEARGSSGYFFPSVKDFTKRRPLARDARSVERVIAAARAQLANAPGGGASINAR